MSLFGKLKFNRGKTPAAVLEAVTRPTSLTLARLALLEKAECPIIFRDISKLAENVRATYLFSIPYEEAVEKMATADKDSLVWLEKVGEKAYLDKFEELARGIVEFWKMLPNTEKKKDSETVSETGGSENLSNGSAEPTATA